VGAVLGCQVYAGVQVRDPDAFAIEDLLIRLFRVRRWRIVETPGLSVTPEVAGSSTVVAVRGGCSGRSLVGLRRRSPPCHDRVEPLETGGRPQGFDVVVDLERWRRVPERDPDSGKRALPPFGI
jgi:hypothetical protein